MFLSQHCRRLSFFAKEITRRHSSNIRRLLKKVFTVKSEPQALKRQRIFNGLRHE